MENEVSTESQATAMAVAGMIAHIGASTDPGKARDQNEDRLVVFDLKRRAAADILSVPTVDVNLKTGGLMLVVADGMGGMNAGETASQMCIFQTPSAYQKHLGTGSNSEARKKAMYAATQEVHQAIYTRARADEKMRGMGCTLTAGAVDGKHLLIAQVGDSRMYLLRGGDIEQLTADQTIYDTLRAAGQDPEKTLGKGPWKSTLTQAMGAQANLAPVIAERELQANDWLVVSSDGLHRVLDLQDIADIVWSDGTPGEKARRMVKKTLEGGAPDNVSVIVAHFAEK